MIKRTAFILSLILGLACASQGQVMMLFTADSLSYITSPLGIDSLFYWFDASQGVTDSLGGAIATDEGVGTWEDLGPGGWDVTQTTNTKRPVYKATGGPASKPCIQFDGSNDILASANHFHGSDDFSIIVVAKSANATRNSAETIVGKNGNGTSTGSWALQGREASSYSMWILISNTGAYSEGPPVQTYQIGSFSSKSTAWRNITATSNGTNDFDGYIDGGGVTTTPLASGSYVVYNVNSTGFEIGAYNNSSPSQVFQGSISEIIMYTKELSSTELAAINNYLNKKYDLY